MTDPGAPGEQQASPAIPEQADRFSLNTSLPTSSAREATTAPSLHSSCDTHGPLVSSEVQSIPFQMQTMDVSPSRLVLCTEALLFAYTYPISFKSKERRK